MYCRAVLEEAAAGGLDLDGESLRVPRSLAGVVLLRVGALSPAARQLVEAAAVLGHRCELAAAVALADLADPLPALGEAVAAGILAEEPGGAVAGIGFSHLLVQRAVYGGLCPARRRRLHQRAAGLVDRDRALGHRVAAAAGPDDGLAGELEAAGREAQRLGRTAQAAAWLAQAAAVSSEPAAADRRLLDALEILVAYGEVAEAEVLAARVAAAGPGARRSWLLGTLDFLAGRTAAAEARLREAWQAHDRARDASVGAAAATRLALLCLVAGRIPEAIEWGERAAAAGAAPAAVRHRALGVLAIALFADGRGPEGLARLAFLPAAPVRGAAGGHRHARLRGMARVLAEDLAGAIADLSTAAARLRAGVPLRTASLCLSYLAGAECRLGSWDDAVVHAELAVSLARDADRVWEFGYVHSVAAVVPALRGDWEVGQRARPDGHRGRPGFRRPGDDQRGRHRPGVPGHGPGRSGGRHGAAAAVRATDRAEFLHSSGPLRLAVPGDRRPHRPGPPRRGGNGAGRAGGGPVTGWPAVGPGGRRPAPRRSGRRGRAPGRRRRGVRDRLASRRGPAGAAGTGPAGDLRRPPAARGRRAAAGHRPAPLGPAAPDRAGRPALCGDLRPGARRRRRACGSQKLRPRCPA